MKNRQISLIIIVFITASQLFSSTSKIRINNLGYLPSDSKKAVFISETPVDIKDFSIHDALTGEICSVYKTVDKWGEFDKFNSMYVLDFSTFNKQGAFYIKALDTYSPTIFINDNIYINISEKLIDYIRTQRFGKDVSGGWWYDASNKNRNASVNASITYQLLYTYSKYPQVFNDKYDEHGNLQQNGIPDIIDEAKWGLNWLLNLKTDPADLALTGKLTAVFALAADITANFYPNLTIGFRDKAIDLYHIIKSQIDVDKPKAVVNYNVNSENWKDDIQLAATQMYLMTYDSDYLKDAIIFGNAEPLPLWLFSNCDAALQFYPYVNWSPFLLSNIENPILKKNYLFNIKTAIQRALFTAKENPFNIGVNLSESSNNKIVALHNLFSAYRNMTGESEFVKYEKALFDWIFGLNPWGSSMVTMIPDFGKTPLHPHTATYLDSEKIIAGALVNGPMNAFCLRNKDYVIETLDNNEEQFQTEWAVYRDNKEDSFTNQPNIDGTVSLLHLIANRQTNASKQRFFDTNSYEQGGIQRFDPNKKQIALIFTGHEYNDGFSKISATLKKYKVKGSFFFSGDFLRKSGNATKIKDLRKAGHLVGPASNHYTKLTDWKNAETTKITKSVFLNDLKENYLALKKLGISKEDAPFFNPPFELYTDSISIWCKSVGVYLVRSTPGTHANLDYTFPEMRENYFSSNEIYNNIMQIQQSTGLNGYILQFNFGSNPARKDKFYKNHLAKLIGQLQNAGYEFVDLFTALN
ncbi:hypothetical protein MASR2M117_24940 [Paludibacter sp.]